MAMHIFLFFFLLIPSLVEGLGLWGDRRLFILYFSTIITFFCVYTSLSVKTLRIPLRAGIAFFFFLLFSTISTFFFSYDKQTSLELLLLYYSSFLFYIFFYNHKKNGDWLTHYFPIILGGSFTFYSLILPFLKQKGLSFLLPVTEKQFVFAFYSNHNHLGDFLGLLVLILVYYCFQKKWVLLPFFVIFFVILITSFSRSAYVALFIAFLLILTNARKKIPSLFLPFIFLILSSIILITFLLSMQLPTHSPFFKLQSYTKNAIKMTPRDVLSGHDIYLKQAQLSIQKYPFFGVGGGNFVMASKNNILSNNLSDSAHNIFLELTTEQGIFATTCFLIFILFIAINVISAPSLSGFLFLYLLINFQTDYTYQLYSLFLFWIILSSVNYTEKREISIPSALYGLFGLVPLIVLLCITTSTLLVKMHNYESAVNWYPFNKEAYINAIKMSVDQTPFYIQQMEQIAPYDLTYIMSTAEYYFQKGNKVQTLKYYKKVYERNNLCSFYFIKQIYKLKRELSTQYQADFFLNKVIYDYQKIFASNSLRKEFKDFCKAEGIEKCPKIGWNN